MVFATYSDRCGRKCRCIVLYATICHTSEYGLHFCRCRQWVINYCRRRDLDSKSPELLHKSYFICAEHFEESQFLNALHNRLNCNAVPTIFNVSIALHCIVLHCIICITRKLCENDFNVTKDFVAINHATHKVNSTFNKEYVSLSIIIN